MKKVTFISKEKLLEMMENKEDFKLVSVRGDEHYREGHLLGALSIPVDRVEELAPQLLPNKDQTIVVYCGSFTCGASTHALKKLQEMSYTNALDYKGGIKDWESAGLGLTTK